jgi:hypothetical protein
MPKRETWNSIFAAFGGIGGLACIFQWAGITPQDLRMTTTVPHVLWLIVGLVLFAVSTTLSIRAGFVQKQIIKRLQEKLSKRDEDVKESASPNLQYRSLIDTLNEKLENSSEAYRQCILERGAAINGAEECMAKLAIFSPLQIKAFQLSNEMRTFLRDYEPIPPQRFGEKGRHEMDSINERIIWRRKLMAAWELRFKNRLDELMLEFGEKCVRITTALQNIPPGKKGPEFELSWNAYALVAMAHQLEGVPVQVRAD